MQVIFRSDLSTPMLPVNMLSEIAWVNHALIALGLAHSQLSDYLGRVFHISYTIPGYSWIIIPYLAGWLLEIP